MKTTSYIFVEGLLLPLLSDSFQMQHIIKLEKKSRKTQSTQNGYISHDPYTLWLLASSGLANRLVKEDKTMEHIER